MSWGSEHNRVERDRKAEERDRTSRIGSDCKSDAIDRKVEDSDLEFISRLTLH